MDKDYADYVKAQINEPPTPRDIGFRLLNPVDGLPAVVDDCRRSTGGLVEIKGNYKDMLAVPFLKNALGTDWVYQATRQWEASEGRPMEWHFADREAADYARQLFYQREWLRGIRVVWTPWLR